MVRLPCMYVQDSNMIFIEEPESKIGFVHSYSSQGLLRRTVGDMVIIWLLLKIFCFMVRHTADKKSEEMFTTFFILLRLGHDTKWNQVLYKQDNRSWVWSPDGTTDGAAVFDPAGRVVYRTGCYLGSSHVLCRFLNTVSELHVCQKYLQAYHKTKGMADKGWALRLGSILTCHITTLKVKHDIVNYLNDIFAVLGNTLSNLLMHRWLMCPRDGLGQTLFW